MFVKAFGQCRVCKVYVYSVQYTVHVGTEHEIILVLQHQLIFLSYNGLKSKKDCSNAFY